MKKCPNCQKEYADHVNFCTGCGAPLQDMSAPKPGFYPQNAPMPPGPGPEAQTATTKSNKLLIGIIIALAVTIITTVTIILIVLSSGDSNADPNSPISQPDSPIAEATATPYESTDYAGGGAQPADNGVTDDSSASTPAPVLSEYNFAEYQQYYDDAEQTFGELIMTSSQKTDYELYLSDLGTALEDRDGESCESNYEHLKQLEKDGVTHSEEALDKLSATLNKLKKKNSSKKAMKTAAYIQAETKADLARDDNKYKTAKKNYKICIDKLKAAAKAAKKKKLPGDEYYKILWKDDDVYDFVTSYIDEEDVRGIDAGLKRYYMNALFAAYGFPFSNEMLQRFFSYQDWYVMDESVTPGNQGPIKEKFKDDYVADHNFRILGGKY